MRSIAFTAHKIAELVEVDDEVPLRPGEVRALTVVSLTSPGTELNGGYLGNAFPKFPGYAAVAEVVETGPEVETVRPGDVVLCPGTHSDVVRCAARDATPVPPGLLPEVAVFARLLGVGLSAVNVMSANPPSRVLVTGLGPIGNLAAQVVSACGFTVTSVDPVVSRRDLAKACGLSDVRADLGEASAGSQGHCQNTHRVQRPGVGGHVRPSDCRPPRRERESCWWAFRGAARPMSRRTHSSTRSFGVTSASAVAGSGRCRDTARPASTIASRRIMPLLLSGCATVASGPAGLRNSTVRTKRTRCTGAWPSVRCLPSRPSSTGAGSEPR